MKREGGEGGGGEMAYQNALALREEGGREGEKKDKHGRSSRTTSIYTLIISIYREGCITLCM